MKTLSEIQAMGITKVTLRCGRNMASASNYSASDDCGSCENNTSNQTEATCC